MTFNIHFSGTKKNPIEDSQFIEYRLQKFGIKFEHIWINPFGYEIVKSVETDLAIGELKVLDFGEDIKINYIDYRSK